MPPLVAPWWTVFQAVFRARFSVAVAVKTIRDSMTMLEEEELKDAALIVFANKQDLPNALPSEAIAEKLGLGSLKSRQWAIFKTSAIKGDGLFDGLDWLVSTLREGKK